MLMTDSFARRVREESVADHRDAERSEFMSAVFSGDVTRVEYAALVVQLQAVYAALDEAAARHRNDAVVGAFFDPAGIRIPPESLCLLRFCSVTTSKLDCCRWRWGFWRLSRPSF